MRIERASIAQVGGNTRRLVQIADGRPTAQGAQALAGGLASVGDAVLRVGLEARAQRDEAAVAKADMLAAQRVKELDQRLAAEPEFDGLGDRAVAEVGKIYDEVGATLRPRMRQVFAARAISARTLAQERYTRLEVERGREAAKAETFAALDQAKQVLADPGRSEEDRDAAEIAALSVFNNAAARGFVAPVDYERARADLRATRTKANVDFEIQQAENAMKLDPGAFLQELAKSERFPSLGAAKREDLRGKALIELERQRKEREREAREAASRYKTELSLRLNNDILAAESGVPVQQPLSVAEIERALGRPSALRYLSKLTEAQVVRAGGVQPIATLQPTNAPPSDDVFANVQREALDRGIARVREQREKDPVAAAISAGLLRTDDGAVATGLAQGDIAALVQAAPERLAFFQSQGQEYTGQKAVKLLTGAEVDAVRQGLASKPAEEQARLLAEMSLALPGRAYRAVVRQVFEAEPVLRQAATLVNASPTDRDNARVLLRGQQLFADKTAKPKLPKDIDLQEAFADSAGDAFAYGPLREQYSGAFDAFKAAYADLAKGGEDLDRRAADRAAAIALGPRLKLNGSTVLLPPGVNPDAYRPKLVKAMEDALRKHDMPAAADRYRVVPSGGRDGVDTYRLISRGNVLRTETGEDVVVQVVR